MFDERMTKDCAALGRRTARPGLHHAPGLHSSGSAKGVLRSASIQAQTAPHCRSAQHLWLARPFAHEQRAKERIKSEGGDPPTPLVIWAEGVVDSADHFC